VLRCDVRKPFECGDVLSRSFFLSDRDQPSRETRECPAAALSRLHGLIFGQWTDNKLAKGKVSSPPQKHARSFGMPSEPSIGP